MQRKQIHRGWHCTACLADRSTRLQAVGKKKLDIAQVDLYSTLKSRGSGAAIFLQCRRLRELGHEERVHLQKK
jgi:hypothetical protein